MTNGDIIIRNAIVHILDSTDGVPVLSDTELSYGSDFADFLKEHIYKIYVSDDKKNCEFIKEESEIYKLICDTDEGNMDYGGLRGRFEDEDSECVGHGSADVG